MTDAEARHAYPADDAVSLFQRSLENHERIDGLEDLRRQVVTSFDDDLVEQLRSGRWRLIDKAAYTFDWAPLQRQMDETKHLMAPHFAIEAPKVIVGSGICLMSYYRRHPIKRRTCAHGAEGDMETARSRESGIIHCRHRTHTAEMIVEVQD